MEINFVSMERKKQKKKTIRRKRKRFVLFFFFLSHLADVINIIHSYNTTCIRQLLVFFPFSRPRPTYRRRRHRLNALVKSKRFQSECKNAILPDNIMLCIIIRSIGGSQEKRKEKENAYMYRFVSLKIRRRTQCDVCAVEFFSPLHQTRSRGQITIFESISEIIKIVNRKL